MMLWPVLTILAVATAVALHFWWRRRFDTAVAGARQIIDDLRESSRSREEQVQTQQAALFDSMVEGLLLLDAAGRVEIANRACTQLFGITGDVKGRTLIEAVRLHEIADLVNSLTADNQVLGCELKISRPSERCVEVNGAAIFESSGKRHGTVLVFHDLTRVKKLERTREEFVANVSHELRTPLSLIKGYAETLLDGAKDNPEVATRFLQTIDRNAERLRLLIEDLLTISQLESGRLQLNLQPVSLREAAEGVLRDLKTRADSKHTELINQVPELTVAADPDRLEQVLANLVDNAIKYGRDGGRVTVSARALLDGQVEVSVEDNGPGMPADALERVFERFYRVDKARSREQGGTGLGLSIVKHIVQTHGGQVWARSEPDRGARFYFTLSQG